MFKIALINMPFASIRLPSIALTQLRSVLAKQLEDQVSTDIFYLNHDFVEYFGAENYARIGDSTKATVSGVGDWLFRQVAFPQLDDNAAQYVQRYARTVGIQQNTLKAYFEIRAGLEAFLDELIDQYELDRFSLVGFTSMFAQNVSSFALARKLKERNDGVVTAMGGANCETSMGAVIARNVEAIDFVFSGPSLKTFPRFVQYLVRREHDKCHEITGIFSKEKLCRNLVSSPHEIGEELEIDVHVPLDYEGFLASLDQKDHEAQVSLLFETSRGCWWGERAHCTFCGLNGTTMKYRALEPENALRQFDQMFEYYPRVTRFESVDNILPRKYLTTVLPRLNPPQDVSIFYEIKADLKDHEMKVLADARVTEIQPGIEALASSTLKLMKKGTTSFQNLRFLKNCLIYGITPVWNLLVGFPGEPEDVYRKYVEDLPLLVHLPPPNGAYPVRFDRFSPYFTMAEQYGLKLRPCHFYGMVYPFPERELDDLAYFFIDENFDNEYTAATAKWIKRLEESCEYWTSRWHQRDGKLKPNLVFGWKDEMRIIQDTRSGVCVDHDLEPAGVQMLDCLAEPMRERLLADKLNGLSESDFDRQLSELQTKGLIFKEGDRYLSLVVNAERDPS